MNDGNLVRQIGPLDSPVARIALSPKGHLLASSSSEIFASFGDYSLDIHLPESLRRPTDVIVQLWDVDNGKQAGKLEGHTAEVTSVAFSADGQYLASASMDKSVRLWRVDTRQQIAKLNTCDAGMLCLAFSPDGRLLAGGGTDKVIRVWSIERTLKTGGSR